MPHGALVAIRSVHKGVHALHHRKYASMRHDIDTAQANNTATAALPESGTAQLDLFGSTLNGDTSYSDSLRVDLVGNVDAPEPVPQDKRLTGVRHTQSLLLWLHRFGWLTSRMVAALIFTQASQSLPLARRLLKKCLADKLVLVRPLPLGGDVYLLSAKGARLLQESTGVTATSGQGLTLNNAIHRACGNWYLISQVQSGLDIFTEHEIASGRAPFQTLNGKQFDGLVLYPPEDNGTRMVTALEVENTWKNRNRRQAAVDTATRHLGHGKMTRVGTDAQRCELYLNRMSIVSTNVDALRSMTASFMEAHRLQIASEMCLACVDVCVCPVSPSLVPGEMVQGNLWWDVVQPHCL